MQIFLPPEQAWTFSRLPGLIAKYKLSPFEVIHVGAHVGEEVNIYKECGFSRIILIEPDPEQIKFLTERFKDDRQVVVISAAVGTDEVETAKFYRFERSVWGTIKTGKESYLSNNIPIDDGIEVSIVSLPNLQASYRNVNFITIDTQGTELDVLKTANLNVLDLVIIEVSDRPNDTASSYSDTVEYMAQQSGWILAERWTHDSSGYDDLVFVKSDL